MKSTTIKLKPLLTCVLQEQVDLNRVNQAYLKTIDAVAGLGTDVPAVLIAIKMLKSSAEFDKYKLKFKVSRTKTNVASIICIQVCNCEHIYFL